MVAISVIVPIYNVEKYLKQCIDSIISQSFRALEIILVDDGSTDSSGDICDKYAEIDLRIVVIHRTNGGLVSARKTGLRQAHGKYVMYVDGDDWIEYNACESMIKCIEKNNSDIVFYDHYENTGSTQKIVRHNVKEGVYDKNALISLIYPKMIAGDRFFEWQVFPSVWDIIVKKDILEQHQYAVDDCITMGEDAACIYPCLLSANTVCFERRAFYHYRQIADSMIKRKPDLESERKCFAVLNKNVVSRLEKYIDVYDVRKQWLAYMMFLMLPRADQLYRGYNKLPFLFPYYEVKRGMKIAIYGAGTYGQRLYTYVKQTNFCEIVAWFDCNYEQLQFQGLDVISPKALGDYSYDGIIIANMFYNSRHQIAAIIKDNINVPIFEIDESVIFTEEYLKGFGLI